MRSIFSFGATIFRDADIMNHVTFVDTSTRVVISWTMLIKRAVTRA